MYCGFFLCKRNCLQTQQVVEMSDAQWWLGYSTASPHVRGLFPASFVELIAPEQQQQQQQEEEGDSVTAAGGVAAGGASADKDAVRQMLWQLGVDKDTLAQVTASMAVAERKAAAGAAAGPEVLEDLPPDLTPEWMGANGIFF
jgi:hypothetical protein